MARSRIISREALEIVKQRLHDLGELSRGDLIEV